MKVLYIPNSAQIGGANRYLLTLWSAARPLGIVPHAACPAPGPMPDACRQAGVECSIVDQVQPDYRRPVASSLAFSRWRRLLDVVKPDIVHANDFRNARSIAPALALSRTPLICHVHFPIQPESIAWTFRFLRKPDLFLINSHAIQRELGPAIARACPGARQRVLHNAVDLEQFQPIVRPPRRIPRVGIVANLIPVKGHIEFLSMASLLAARGADAEYWIVGEDIHQAGYGEALRERARRMRLEHVVHFLGYRHDVNAILGDLDVLVSCSHDEPFGISLIEAMARQLPVVATRVGGVPEVIEHEVTGFLVPPRSPEALAEAVGSLVRNSDLRLRMGAAGRRRVERHFDANGHARTVANVYEQLAPASSVHARGRLMSTS